MNPKNQMTIDCPSCGTPLLVPEAAAGRKARCTRCETRFVIPSVEEMLEQTVTQMALEELDSRYHERDLATMHAESSEGRRMPRPDYPVSRSGTVLGMPAVTDQGNPDDSSTVLSVDNFLPQRQTLQVNDPAPKRAADLSQTSPLASGENADSEAVDDEEGYPQELRSTTPRPYLVVLEAKMSGVRLAFASEWLNHETFRTSLPLRCAFCGKGPEASLISRPMVFLNRNKKGIERARAIELRYEQSVGPHHSPREHTRTISRLEELCEPFDRPILYYATTGHPGDALECTVRSDEAGRDYCVVMIPCGEVAVDWLARVNGRCGREYALLAGAVANLRNDAWNDMSDKTRKRLETWCKFEKGERFKLYLNDADLTLADAGLGGVVVTDRRFMHHKFRRSRSLSLNQAATLHVRTDEQFARLTLESFGRKAPAGKIHRADLDKLINAVADAHRLKVLVGRAAPGEAVV